VEKMPKMHLYYRGSKHSYTYRFVEPMPGKCGSLTVCLRSFLSGRSASLCRAITSNMTTEYNVDMFRWQNQPLELLNRIQTFST
jgi:hypothetical protein